MKAHLYAVIAGFLVFVSCSQPQEETVDFKDLAPNSERYKDGDPTEKPADTLAKDQRPAESAFLAIVDTLLTNSRWIKWDTVLFADRFGPKTQEKWQVIGPNDSLVLLKYTFKDSLRVKNALFNWLDCFGPKCISYTVGGNLRIPRRQALILVGSQDLLVIEGNGKIDEKRIRKSLQPDPKKENWLYIIAIPRSGKTIWKRIEKGEEKPIVKNENS